MSGMEKLICTLLLIANVGINPPDTTKIKKSVRVEHTFKYQPDSTFFKHATKSNAHLDSIIYKMQPTKHK